MSNHLVKIEIKNYSFCVCPVCWKKKDDTTTYTHQLCWKKLSKIERDKLFSEFNPYQPKNKTGKRYVVVEKNWRISNEKRDA